MLHAYSRSWNQSQMGTHAGLRSSISTCLTIKTIHFDQICFHTPSKFYKNVYETRTHSSYFLHGKVKIHTVFQHVYWQTDFVKNSKSTASWLLSCINNQSNSSISLQIYLNSLTFHIFIFFLHYVYCRDISIDQKKSLRLNLKWGIFQIKCFSFISDILKISLTLKLKNQTLFTTLK